MINMAGKVHQPGLSTIRMIEEFVKKNSGEYTRTEIWKRLPRKVMYQTFKIAFDYLAESNKIIFNNRHAIWIFDPKSTQKLLEQSVKI
jgi:outer membrane lipoprotein-sorting protein